MIRKSRGPGLNSISAEGSRGERRHDQSQDPSDDAEDDRSGRYEHHSSHAGPGRDLGPFATSQPGLPRTTIDGANPSGPWLQRYAGRCHGKLNSPASSINSPSIGARVLDVEAVAGAGDRGQPLP